MKPSNIQRGKGKLAGNWDTDRVWESNSNYIACVFWQTKRIWKIRKKENGLQIQDTDVREQHNRVSNVLKVTGTALLHYFSTQRSARIMTFPSLPLRHPFLKSYHLCSISSFASFFYQTQHWFLYFFSIDFNPHLLRCYLINKNIFLQEIPTSGFAIFLRG